MISCDDFVKMNGGVMNWLWWFWENEWGRDIVGTDDFWEMNEVVEMVGARDFVEWMR